MKKLILIGILFLGVQFISAQERDSTTIKLGKSRITIYDENAKELEALKKSQQEFKSKAQALRDSIALIKKEMELEADTTLVAQFKKNIEELKKQKEAYEKGIADLNKEVEKLKDQSYKFEIGQEDEEDNDIHGHGDFKFGDHKKKRKFKGHWAGFDMGMSNYTNVLDRSVLPDDGKFMELNTNRSWTFDLNLVQFNFPLFSRYMGFVSGFGFNWTGYGFKQNMKLAENTDGVIYGNAINDSIFKKNKLNITYFKVPLMFEFHIPVNKKDRRIFISAGVEGKIKLRAKYKQIYDLGGKEQKDVLVDDYQLNPFAYGLTARIGYRSLRVHASYSLSPLFETGQGPELYPFEMGITLVSF